MSSESYAVISTGGRQFRVSPGDVVEVDRLAVEAGAEVTFDRVLLCETGGGVKVGTPIVEGASVKGTVLDERRDRKVLIFKKKRRSTYRRTRGHRQHHTLVKIDSIDA